MRPSRTRSYRGILATIGDIGGTKDILFGLFALLYLLQSSYDRKARLVEAVYGVPAEKKSGCCKKKRVAPTTAKDQTQQFIDIANPQPVSQKSQLGIMKTLNTATVNWAYDGLQDKLDIAYICRELYSLTFICKFLMTENQTILLPMLNLMSARQTMSKKLRNNSVSIKDIQNTGDPITLNDLNLAIRKPTDFKRPSSTTSLMHIELAVSDLTKRYTQSNIRETIKTKHDLGNSRAYDDDNDDGVNDSLDDNSTTSLISQIHHEFDRFCWNALKSGADYENDGKIEFSSKYTPNSLITKGNKVEYSAVKRIMKHMPKDKRESIKKVQLDRPSGSGLRL